MSATISDTDLAPALTEYVQQRGLHLDPDILHLVQRTIALGEGTCTVNEFVRAVSMSRSALDCTFRKHGLPAPSRWLQFSRLLRAVIRLQQEDRSVNSMAYELGYSEASNLSLQLHRITGLRPGGARLLPWTAVVDAWLEREGCV